MDLQELLAKGIDLERFIDSRICDLRLPADDRTVFGAACLDLTHEHCKAIRLLLNQPKEFRLVGSAFALIRPTFEAFVRGVWLLHSATNAEVVMFADDRVKGIDKLLADLESVGYADRMLAPLKRSSWDAMCSYTHGGQFQAVRRMTHDRIGPAYPDDEVAAVAHYSVMWTGLAGIEALQLSGRGDLATDVVGYYKQLFPNPIA